MNRGVSAMGQWPMGLDSEQAQRLLDSVPVLYVVADNRDYPNISTRYATPLLEKYQDLWKRVYVASGGNERVDERRQ